MAQDSLDRSVLLEADGLVTSLVARGELRPVVRDMSFTVHAGEVVGLVGESGSGKSVTARSVIRLLPRGAHSSGRLTYKGIDILSLDKNALREFRRTGVGMIFQDPRAHIDPLWKVEDYVGEGLREHRKMSRKEARACSADLLQRMGIIDVDRVLDSYPGQLSGGMLQRVMIAGALSCEPAMIIADEATTALDVTVQADILAILRKLQVDQQIGVLFITHDLGLAAVICDRIIVMYAGLPMLIQDAKELFTAPAHPYAAALVRARPRIDVRSTSLQGVGGSPASALDNIKGCPFEPRCSYAIPECTSIIPKLLPLGAGLSSECIRANEIRDELRESVHVDS